MSIEARVLRLGMRARDARPYGGIVSCISLHPQRQQIR
jgi:hypothetical protein